MEDQKTQTIKKLNDLFRTTFTGGRVFMTLGINALPEADQSKIVEQVQTFSDFNEDYDTYGEHDFGAFDHERKKIVWKIDYYNRDMIAASEDPADPKQTTRVLTIMLVEEY